MYVFIHEQLNTGKNVIVMVFIYTFASISISSLINALNLILSFRILSLLTFNVVRLSHVHMYSKRSWQWDGYLDL